MKMLSVLMICAGGLSVYVTYTANYNDMSTAFQILPIFWTVIGIMFMLGALFGILVAFKKSTVLANLVRSNDKIIFLVFITINVMMDICCSMEWQCFLYSYSMYQQLLLALF